MKILRSIGVLWITLAFLFWLLVNITEDFSFTIFYYLVWIFIVGGLLWKYHEKISNKLQTWSLPRFWKIVLLGYAAIITEEFLAGLTHAFNEGLSISLIFLRVQQFEAFNMLTFAGFIFGWAILLGKINYSRKELFILAGLWGLFAEQQWMLIITNPLVFLSLGTLTFMTYGIIMTPMMLAVSPKQGKNFIAPLRWILAYCLLFLLSIVPIAVLSNLIKVYPERFPPDEFVA